MTSRSVVFATPARTAIGTFGGSLKDVLAPVLGETAIRGAVTRAGIRPAEVETVVMGNVVQVGTKMNPTRRAAVHTSGSSTSSIAFSRRPKKTAESSISSSPMPKSCRAWRDYRRDREQ
jgi:acetyl-CoA acetyltransferase